MQIVHASRRVIIIYGNHHMHNNVAKTCSNSRVMRHARMHEIQYLPHVGKICKTALSREYLIYDVQTPAISCHDLPPYVATIYRKLLKKQCTIIIIRSCAFMYNIYNLYTCVCTCVRAAS